MPFLKQISDFVRNARVVRNSEEFATLIPDYLKLRYSRQIEKADFDAVHTFVIFIGIGRSGTTLFGALLDAHPDIIIANQQCVLKYLYPVSFSHLDIFSLLLQNSRKAALKGRPGGGGYDYQIDGQSQGQSNKIRVIGDKSKSAQSVSWLMSRPELLSKLVSTTNVRLRMLHVIRNPFDTIARRSLRRNVSIDRISREYFDLTNKLNILIERVDSSSELDIERIPVHLEDLCANPSEQLQRICIDLGVETGDDYIKACSSIINPVPSEARWQVQWKPEQLASIQKKCVNFAHLERYTFN